MATTYRLKRKTFGFMNVMGAFGKGGNFANAMNSSLGAGKRAWEATKGMAKVGVAAAPVAMLGTGLALGGGLSSAANKIDD